ncbi:MAG: septum formation protein Maf [Candidatus Cloacimonetes bacterium 4572_65]|nr:MAG: septum formation protein Maf [Candidatus Cloacimonetes bacterium 4572_65]
MLENLLKDKKVVLASESPRRRDIFKMVGINALQMPANIDEVMLDIAPFKMVQHYAKSKAEVVASHLDKNCVVVGSDTVVFHDGVILAKPKTKYEATDYLTRLSGDKHTVYTGVAISYKGNLITFYEKSVVEFDTLADSDIIEYIESGDCFDKAGAYGIQGISSQFIKKINGCYYNVMGFPINRFYKELKKLIVKVG